MSEYIEVPFDDPVVSDTMEKAALSALREELHVRGESIERFEDAFAEYVGVEHAVAVDSGTRALYFALKAAGIGTGDTILTTTATVISTANAIQMTGAEPKFADVDLEDYLFDFEEIERIVTQEDVDAIVPVHLYGHPVDVTSLRDICDSVPIVTDACEAHGAAINGDMVGSMGTAAAFSFYPTKNVSVAGDGGMVTTDDESVADTVRKLRDLGREDPGSYDHEILGYTARLNTINAAIGEVQLQNVESWNTRRRDIAATYFEELSGIDGLSLPPGDDSATTPAWYVYVVRTEKRDDLQEYLEERGIQTGIHFPSPVHLQTPYRTQGYSEGQFPAAEKWAETVLSLPIYPEMKDEAVEHVVSVVRSFFGTDRA